MTDITLRDGRLHIDCQSIYDDLRFRVLEELDKPGGAYGALGGLATLLGEVIKGAPPSMQASLREEAIEILDKTLAGNPVVILRH